MQSRPVYIYKYTNLVNAKIYVGSTTKPKTRHQQHIRLSKYKDFFFYRAIREYGWESFSEMDILEICTQESRNDRENYWIKHYGTLDDRLGYNLQLANSTEKSLEVRQKISQSKIGERNPMYGRSGELNSMYGRCGPLNPNFGKPCSDEIRAKLKGRKRTDEQKNRIRQSHIGRKDTESAKSNKAIAQRLRFDTQEVKEETKKKISEHRKAYWAKRKQEAKESGIPIKHVCHSPEIRKKAGETLKKTNERKRKERLALNKAKLKSLN